MEDLSTMISGNNLLNSIAAERRAVAERIWKLRGDISFFDIGAKKRNKIIRIAFKNADVPAKPNADDLEREGLELLRAAHLPCPPLPCGADDAWIENAEYIRYAALASLDAAAILKNREAYRQAPNIHAFDESYYGED